VNGQRGNHAPVEGIPYPRRESLRVVRRERVGFDDSVRYWRYAGIDSTGRQWTWYEKEVNGIFQFAFDFRWHMTPFNQEEITR